MGHLGHMKEEYQQLVRRLEAGPVALPEPDSPRARAGLREILEILYTPEEAALAARLPVKPASLEAIARRVGCSPEELQPKLDAMADKGVVMDLVGPNGGETKYLLSPPVVGFFEFSLMRAKDLIPKKRMAEALDAYTHGDPAFAIEVFGKDTVLGRAMVHETALGDDVLPDVLDWERATCVVGEAKSHALAYCYCRHEAEHVGRRCDAPIETCLSLNAGADFIIRRKFGRAIERSEALDVLVRARESGLVQIADNVQSRPTYVCNCCGCCCGQLQAINRYDLPAVNPSPFQAAPELSTCKGCSRCSRACPVGAITMHPKPLAAGGKRKRDLEPRVDHDRCIGCGVCVQACNKTRSMKMQRRPEKPYVPVSTLERVVRQALERGRLPHLLFDEGGSRGAAFLNRATQALCSLPAVDRALATEQVRSRFIRFALSNVQDPTA